MGREHRPRAQHPLIGLRRPGRRSGSAAAETVLVAPLLLAVLWLLFFFAGALRQRQDVIVTARSGTWNHARVFGERNHVHDMTIDPAYYPDIITWTGDPTADWYITSNYHLPADTNPSVTQTEMVGFVPSSLKTWRAGAGGGGDPFGAEHWVVTAEFQGRTSNVVGQSIERTLSARLKMDAGCWTWAMHPYQAHAAAESAGASEDAAVNSAADDMVARNLVQVRVANLFRALSVLR